MLGRARRQSLYFMQVARLIGFLGQWAPMSTKRGINQISELLVLYDPLKFPSRLSEDNLFVIE